MLKLAVSSSYIFLHSCEAIRMTKVFLLITMTPLLLIWGGKAFSDEIGYGEIADGIYVNTYFNMSIPTPAGWAIQSKAAIEELSELGGNLVAGDDQNLQVIIEAAEKQTVNLFAFFKHEAGAPVDFNPSVSAVAERVAQMPGIKRGSDYLFHVKKLLQAGQIKYIFPKDVFTEEISGASFDVMPTELEVGSMTIYQEYYSTRIKDYVLSFILTYSSEAESDELRQVVSHLKL